MPRSIAQLIFSGLGGINPGGARNYATAAGGPIMGRPYRDSSRAARGTRRAGPPPRNPSSGRSSSSPRRRGAQPGSGTASLTSGGPASSSASVRVASSPGGLSVIPGPGTTSRVSITLNSRGPTSFALPGPPPPGFLGSATHGAAPFAFAASAAPSDGAAGRRHGTAHSSHRRHGDGSDEDIMDPMETPYNTFVRRARAAASNAGGGSAAGGGRASSAAAAAAIASASSGPGRFAFLPSDLYEGGPMLFGAYGRPVPPTRRNVPPASTVDTAIEIGDSDSDDDVICVD